jgi:hypothetical protein
MVVIHQMPTFGLARSFLRGQFKEQIFFLNIFPIIIQTTLTLSYLLGLVSKTRMLWHGDGAVTSTFLL